MSKPVLVDTDTACVFIIRAREQDKTVASMKAARKHVYYLARVGKLTRYGGRQSALWDLKELARPYRKITVVSG